MIDSYRKDLEEFGTGLKKEIVVIRSVASCAVNESLEISAFVT
ncbi:hypothetical protein SLEP1_g33194 [Rubroshorea leprosula]|uniref:Uncharacterized protein n=1 Tax=Rubroshorea leprosula TaxID=152421 RepID=A0AAV5KFU4_9ROSI|nr:hypothetical protein SLEP1_g33194 [Rubroshorea leprosula]